MTTDGFVLLARQSYIKLLVLKGFNTETDMYLHGLVCLVFVMCTRTWLQEASKNADELLEAEEKERSEAEKRRTKNKKVRVHVDQYYLL